MYIEMNDNITIKWRIIFSSHLISIYDKPVFDSSFLMKKKEVFPYLSIFFFFL
jgi:hypothetical protein